MNLRQSKSIDEREHTCHVCEEMYGCTDAIGAVNEVLGEDRARAAFVDDAVRVVVLERNCLRVALQQLVRLKDGPRDNAYREEKDKAWQAARELLGVTFPVHGDTQKRP